jgi:hypothetical protein
MDEDWDWDSDHIVDLDVTGDPQLDQFGYQSPRRDFSPPPAPEFDYLAQFHADQAKIEADNARRAAKKAQSPPRPRGGNEGWSSPLPTPPPLMPQPVYALMPQHGADFEVRTVRPWYAPWRKNRVWRQISAWQVGPPPAGATVVTVPDVAALPGTVRTIGAVGESGAVEY